MTEQQRHPGLYVHIPFCKTKCPYCDFYSTTSHSSVGRWLQALEKEALFYKRRFDTFDTLYLGGGTPTSLTGTELAFLIQMLRRHFAFSADAEATLEANPDDIAPQRLNHFQALGINRISLGVQSFADDELKFLGRRSSVEQNERALEWIEACGSFSIAVDLMYGFCGQTTQSWRNTLDRVLQFSPEHLSCYQLSLEPDTPFGRMKSEGLIEPLSEAQQADFFLLTSEHLEANGYIHYEISNFASDPEHMSRHNRKYWCHAPYLGLGPAAHSFQNDVRWWNVRSVEQYCLAVEGGKPPVAESEALSPEQLRLEALYLGLRTRDGVSADAIGASSHCRSSLKQLQTEGLVKSDKGSVIPTKKGFLVADSLPLLFLD